MSSTRRRSVRVLGAVVALIVLLAGAAAFAQRSGGRYGGSRGFGSGSSGSSYRSGGSSYRSGGGSSWGSGSSGYRSPSSSGGGGGSYYYPSSNYSPSAGGACGCAGIAIALVVVIAILLIVKSSRSNLSDQRPAMAPSGFQPALGAEVRRISIAFDWTARAQIQAALDRSASSFDMNSPYGLWQAANAASELLKNALGAARYACFQSFPVPQAGGDAQFARVTADLQRRYGQATVDNARRVVLANPVTAHSEEGQGMVVVSIVVGVMNLLPRLPQWPSRATLWDVLNALIPQDADRLVALEVVWSPSVDSDRLSSAELEVLYPDLVRLDGDAGVGRVVCEHCRCVFARELGKCPACGSPSATPAPGSSSAQPMANAGTTMPCKWCRHPMPAYEVQCANCGGRTDR